MHDRILSFLEQRFGVSRAGRALDVDTTLFSSGIVDSFGVLEVIAFLETTFEVQIDPGRHDLAEFDSAGKMAALVTALRSQRTPG